MKKNEHVNNIIAEYYSSHYEELLGFVTKRLNRYDVSEDVVQDVFLRLLSTDKMITETTLPNLVYTIARNLIFDYWRHCRSVEEYEHYISGTVNYSDDAASVYSAIEITEILERGIAQLNNKQRNIYRMSIYDGMKVSEISDKLEIKYKSVENNLGIARKEIREYMKRMLA